MKIRDIALFGHKRISNLKVEKLLRLDVPYWIGDNGNGVVIEIKAEEEYLQNDLGPREEWFWPKEEVSAKKESGDEYRSSTHTIRDRWEKISEKISQDEQGNEYKIVDVFVYDSEQPPANEKPKVKRYYFLLKANELGNNK